MNTLNKPCLAAAAAAVLVSAASLLAEEGGIGHYMPGAMATLIDGAPALPDSLTVTVAFNSYNGSFESTQSTPVGGSLWLGVSRRAYTTTTTGYATFREPFLGSILSVGFAVPYTFLDISANAVGVNAGQSVTEEASSVGDIMLIPAALNWLQGPLRYQLLFPIYAPTGSYSVGRLANIGRNTWAFEPTIGVRYLGTESLVEFTSFAAVGFSTTNEDTDYKSGTVFHWEATFAKHGKLNAEESWGVGLSGFYYRQITDDSGAGAVLGGFRAQSAGLGPVLSYVNRGKLHTSALELKWLPEFNAKNRPEGDIVWVKASVSF